MKQRLLSGVKPTGKVHIGNYFGAMRQFVELQNKDYEAFVMIADYHTLNFVQDAKQMRDLTRDMILDYLAVGLDPEKVVLFRQSDVSAHTELAWIFDTITTMPYLMRAHAFKDAEAKNKEISVGTFNYPMLMASDILLYKPDIVPVGLDQKQHVEIARDTAEKFNRIFGEVFKLPKEYIPEAVATVPGTDGRKMSKSYGNTIELFAEDDEIKKAVMSIVTDSNGGIPENVFAIHKLLKSEEELAPFYESNKGSYKILKEALAADLIDFITPLREKRKALEADDSMLTDILEKGALRAKAVADETLKEAKKAIGVLL